MLRLTEPPAALRLASWASLLPLRDVRVRVAAGLAVPSVHQREGLGGQDLPKREGWEGSKLEFCGARGSQSLRIFNMKC